MGPLKQLMLKLGTQHGVRQFIETGTFKADTSIWAAAHFDHVTTVEWSEQLHLAAKARDASVGNITFLRGSSPDVLPAVVEALEKPALFWLDAHTCACQLGTKDNAHGHVEDICPTLEEVEIINRSKVDHFILIDDARLFLVPPPPPHNPEKWPDLAMIMRALNAVPGRYIVIVQDVIVAVPLAAKATLQGYCREVTKPWESPHAPPAQQPNLRLLPALRKVLTHPRRAVRAALTGVLKEAAKPLGRVGG